MGHQLITSPGKWMAAVLACGPDAVLSYRSAAALWGIRRSARGRIELTVRAGRRPQAGVQLHHDRLAVDEVTIRDGIPVTTPARTLLDLAAVLDRHQLERALNEAEVQRLTDTLTVAELLSRHPRRRGAATLHQLLDAGFSGITRSELEDRFLRFLDSSSLPSPELNAPIEATGEWFECDCVWRRQRVIVELDGHATHGTRMAFERDRERDRALQADGWRVVRVTWRQLAGSATALAADLSALISAPYPADD